MLMKRTFNVYFTKAEVVLLQDFTKLMKKIK